MHENNTPNTIERTFVMLKPDAVQRCFVGEILTRFEKVGLKIVGLKLVWVTEEFARQHYTEDLEKRRGKQVRDYMVDFIKAGPVVAICFEGVHAIEIVRKMIGSTEPRAASPGTIRGDYSHVSYAHCDKLSKGVRNIVHASADAKDAAYEVNLWFTDKELHSYSTVHDIHVL